MRASCAIVARALARVEMKPSLANMALSFWYLPGGALTLDTWRLISVPSRKIGHTIEKNKDAMGRSTPDHVPALQRCCEVPQGTQPPEDDRREQCCLWRVKVFGNVIVEEGNKLSNGGTHTQTTNHTDL
jgi:hypothetical protein